jgi:CxxC motif-containing protein (DUF1111 family)
MKRNLRRTIGTAGAFMLLAATALAQNGTMGNPPTQGRSPTQGQPPAQPPPPPPPPQVGGAIAGLTAAQTTAWNAGRAQFITVETVASGLGPIFNDVSCVACHSNPVAGGASPKFVTRFGRTTNGVFDPLESLGGSLLQAKAINPAVQEFIPSQANTIAHRKTPQLFGLGLIEAIPDTTIQALALRPSVDGITGRAAIVTDVVSGLQRVGRFGMKAQHATILAFSADAYLNEMGITNPHFPTENAPNGNTALLAKYSTVSEPNDTVNPVTGRSDVNALADFQQLLAPPSPLTLTAQATAGQQVFSNIGCAYCHVPELTTGTNPIAALSNKTAGLYSDLLLHDMGPLGDGIAQAAALPSEMRTPPLWGLRLRQAYLHDGRATTLDAAIRAHVGQGQAANTRYTALSSSDQQALITFLNSL